MKAKYKNRGWFLIILSIIILLISGFFYLRSVQRSLWEKSLTDILEVTTQGRHALDTYIEKDMEMLSLIVAEAAAQDPQNEEALSQCMKSSGTSDSSYICVNLDSGMLYTGFLNRGYSLNDEQLAMLSVLQGKGIREPFLDGRTGVWTLGYYETFTWPDGTKGLVQKTQPLSEIAERFSLSFYNDTGFSYVVNQDGDILLRSMHRNSNRTFHNLFDIIDLQGNDAQQVKAFESALKAGNRGVARFWYQEEEYIFCYVPMKNAPGWYVVSIIPNHVIMEQANSIVKDSQVFLILILGASVVMAAFFILYRNSTRQILLAEEKARKAAESANIAKSRFLSNMSHDIRTPMNAVLGMTNLALEHIDEPDRLQGYLENINVSGQLLVGLINDILDMSKIESGKMTLNIDTASLDMVLEKIVKIIQPTAAKKNLSFDIQLHRVEHKTLCFDVLRLNQILINLLSNAVKFTPENGSIRMDITESPSEKKDHAHLTFCIADTGIGMSQEFKDHIFDSFTREQNDHVNKIEGSGLGMAISKMIVDMMEGTIKVDSEAGKGTIFTVDLDFLIPDEIPIFQPSDEKINLSGRHILLADDNAINQQIAYELLTELGAIVTTADDGLVCTQEFENSPAGYFDLILMDIQMPNMNGYEATEKIREMDRPDAAQIPIFALTADAFAEDIAAAKKAGMNSHLAKPLDIPGMMREIQKYVK